MYHKNSMATASLIFGILAVLSGSVFLVAVGLGALSVLCALLSRTERHLSGKSIAGMLAGIFAAVSSCAMTAYSFYSVMNNPQARAYYSQIFSTLLEEYGLPDSYNFFDDGSGNTSDGTTDEAPGSSAPSPDTDNGSSDRHQSNDDYFDSLYDDYFRYFYGADPYHEETPAPAAPSAPSADSSQGDFI